MESAGPSQLELTVLDWFKEWIGYPAQAAGLLSQRRLGGEHDARSRARASRCAGRCATTSSPTSPTRRTRRSPAPRGLLGFRPDQLRVLPADASCRMRPDALEGAIDADVRAGRTPLLVCAARRLDEHGRGRSARRARGDLPRARRLAARRCRVRRLRGAHRARAEAAGGHRARRLGHARPAQVALPAVRVRLPAGPRGPAAAARVRDHARLPARTRRSPSGEVNFSDLRPPAHARLARAEGLAVAPDLRARRLPRRDRPLARPRRARASSASRRRDELELLAPGELGHRLLPPPLRRRRRTSRARGAQRARSSRGSRRSGVGARVLDASARRATRSACAC